MLRNLIRGVVKFVKLILEAGKLESKAYIINSKSVR